MKKSNRISIKRRLGQKAEKAFSLIEMLLVLFIIGLLFTVTSQKFYNKGHKVRTVFDRLARLNNRLVSVSTLHNKTYRLVIQLNTEKKDQYWVEKKQAINESEEEEKTDSVFQIDNSFYSEPQNIPSLLDMTKIETKGSAKEEGKVYIYYYPSALAQSAKIYFLRPDNQGTWTLYLDPVTKKLKALKGEK
ncbi:MAG: prepilin-type N-terminal cleavage/methylation domain-containing protein [Oligoflexia bacterium]|nr:prepilin-type N-terminal cleavage/methylation domain-containing protein [Oligoflexia bacterium]